MLDGQVRDAASRVEDVRAHEGAGRTRVQARRARAAAVRLPRVGRKLGRGQDDADEEVRAERRRQEIRVLADPAEPHALGEVALEHGARVHGRAAADALPRGLGDEPGQLAQARPHQGVVVQAARVAGDRPPARVGVGAAVRERDGDDRAAARQQALGVEALGAPPRQIVHRAGVAGVEPALERRAVLGRPGRAERDRVEAEPEGPRPHRLGERARAEPHAFRALTTRWARVSVRPPSVRNFA